MEKESKEVSFICYLESLLEDENRAALAALRRGLSGPPGTVPDTFPYIVPFLPKDIEADSPRAMPYFIIASLFALYFSGKGKELSNVKGHNIGRAFLQAKIDEAKAKGKTEKDIEKETSIDSRFVALLNAHYDDLSYHLRYAISFLKSREIPLDWHKLFKHLCHWSHPNRWVQKELAKGFWGHYKLEEETVKTEQ